jgi:hypothetical protein
MRMVDSSTLAVRKVRPKHYEKHQSTSLKHTHYKTHLPIVCWAATLGAAVEAALVGVAVAAASVGSAVVTAVVGDAVTLAVGCAVVGAVFNKHMQYTIQSSSQ